MALVSEIDEVFKILNKVQTSNEEQTFYLKTKDEDIAPTVENIIKDSTLVFEREDKRGKIVYRVSPGEIDFAVDIELEEFEDEFLENFEIS